MITALIKFLPYLKVSRVRVSGLSCCKGAFDREITIRKEISFKLPRIWTLLDCGLLIGRIQILVCHSKRAPELSYVN